MLVEDDKSLREIYSIRLVAEGYSIVSAGDGEEALAVAVKEKPDLILSDVMMPKISGFDMLDILRSTPETKDIKVIMMTALSSEDQRMRGESLGANMYLVKSQVGIEDVVNAVHTVLGDRPTPSAGAILATTASLATSQAPTNLPSSPSPQPAPMPPSQTPTPQYSTPSAPASGYLQDNPSSTPPSSTPSVAPSVGASALIQETGNEVALSSESIAPKLAPIDNGNTEPVAHTMEEQMDQILEEAAAEERANEERLRQQAEAEANKDNTSSANDANDNTTGADDNSANTDSQPADSTDTDTDQSNHI